MTMTSTARSAQITVTANSWDESRDGEVDAGHAIGLAKFTTEWAGEISGRSTAWLIISYVGDPDKPETLTGPYTGYELVTGSLDGRRGTFVLATTGFHGDGVARTEVSIVEGSGTGELASITGSGSYAAEAMEYTLELNYDLG